MKETPITISTLPTTLPRAVVGTTSPYPTVVMVCSAHQTASPNDGKLCGSAIRIRTAPTSANATNVTAKPTVTDRALAIRRARRSIREGCPGLGVGALPVTVRIQQPAQLPS